VHYIEAYTDWAPLYNLTPDRTLPGRCPARLALGVQPGNRILDLACGTGLNFTRLSRLAGKEGLVVGVDLTPAMLEIACANIARRGLDNVEVCEADAANLHFSDDGFDRAIVTYALNIIPDYAGAIQEVHRVLAYGGRFVALELHSGFSLPGWLQPLPHICVVDVAHRTLEVLRRVFRQVEVRQYWVGMLYLAVATKG
jgi:ubiquinone/menaquinone biosynthesis C-methylase UbiE